MSGGIRSNSKGPARVWIAVAAVVVVAAGATAAWVLSQPGDAVACTTAGAQGPIGSTPEEAARLFVAIESAGAVPTDAVPTDDVSTETMPTETAAADTTVPSTDGPPGYDRHGETEWRYPTGVDSYRKIDVGRTDDGAGWQVTGANECFEVEA